MIPARPARARSGYRFRKRSRARDVKPFEEIVSRQSRRLLGNEEIKQHIGLPEFIEVADGLDAQHIVRLQLDARVLQQELASPLVAQRHKECRQERQEIAAASEANLETFPYGEGRLERRGIHARMRRARLAAGRYFDRPAGASFPVE